MGPGDPRDKNRSKARSGFIGTKMGDKRDRIAQNKRDIKRMKRNWTTRREICF